ncbi:MAG: peroxiredoxin family protein [Planctomycetota bacterium]
MKPRLIVLLVAVSLAAAASLYRATHPIPRKAFDPRSLVVNAAPGFQLLDQHDRQTSLKSYLHRYPILICFYDASTGPDADPVMQELARRYDALKSGGYRVFAISSPLGPDHKPEAQKYPFPILRDTLAGQSGSCSNRWGRLADGESNPPIKVRPALFLIRQDGMVSWDGALPRPVEDPFAFLATLR